MFKWFEVKDFRFIFNTVAQPLFSQKKPVTIAETVILLEI